MTDSRGETPKLGELVETFLELTRAGKEPDRERLLAEHPDVAEQLRQSLAYVGDVEPESGGDLQGRTLGRYEIIREVGRGGMGVVYEARDTDLDRQVALKVLPFAGMLDPRHLQRFQTEAQAAARLHHSNIVPVFGVGSDKGVHYFAMQYIDGQDLASVIRERSSDGGAGLEESTPLSNADTGKAPRFVRTVVELGVKAAEALDYAHQVGVVHRDIKPGNLMVDRGGTLWVMDFGLAQIERDAGVTMTGDLVGTFRYMSPEQALAKRVPIDHRTDIYSLAATLYELLTLQPAVKGDTPQAVLQEISFKEPVPPRRLNPAIPAGLETILVKAMAKDPAARYATAQEMANDFQRLLENKPVLAKRPTLFDRTTKWARRNRTLVASGFVVLVTAVVALGLSTWNIARAESDARAALDRAETSLTFAHQAVDEFLLEVGIGGEEPLPGPARRKLLEKALRFYDTFLTDRDDFLAIRNRGLILHALHRYAETLDTCDRILEIAPGDVTGRASNGEPASVSSHLVALVERGHMLWHLDRYDEALSSLDRATRIDPAYAGAHNSRGVTLNKLGRHAEALRAVDRAIEIDPDFAVAHVNRGYSLWKLDRLAEALQAFDRAIELDPDLVQAHINRGSILNDRLGRHAEALQAFDRVIGIDPAFAMAHANRGRALLDLGRPAEALEACDRAIELDPDFANAHIGRANALLGLGRNEEALQAIDRAIEIDPDNATAHGSRGIVFWSLGKQKEALQAFDRAVASDPNDARAHGSRGMALGALGRLEEALSALDRAIELAPDIAYSHANRGMALSRLGRPADALLAYERAIELGVKDPRLIAEAERLRASTPAGEIAGASYRAGKWQQAVSLFEESMKLRDGGDAHDWLYVSMALGQLDQKEEAREWYDKSDAWIEKHSPDDDELAHLRAEAAMVLGIEDRG